MKKIIGVIMIMILVGILVGINLFNSNKEENVRYITDGIVTSDNGLTIDLDWLNENSGEDCLQVYYDNETNYIHWVYSESAMVE